MGLLSVCFLEQTSSMFVKFGFGQSILELVGREKLGDIDQLWICAWPFLPCTIFPCVCSVLATSKSTKFRIDIADASLDLIKLC